MTPGSVETEIARAEQLITRWRGTAEAAMELGDKAESYTITELLDEIEPLLAALSASSREWLPIETFDGGEDECDSVLVACDGVVGEAIWRGTDDGWWWINNHPTDAYGERLAPTHWQPLPDPPARSDRPQKTR